MIEIKILGKGCSKCEKLEAMVIKAAEEMKLDYSIEKVSDINEITGYGVMMTPALVVDEKVKTSGKIPTRKKIKEILSS